MLVSNSTPLEHPAAGSNGTGILLHGMVGSSAAMQHVYDSIARVAPTDTAVLIHGETGVGKELVARAIHRHSSRAGGTFVAINCPGLREDLTGSELFGHFNGAFGGTATRKKGKLELADGGTLLLDEIRGLPLTLQARLLRALEQRELERAGETDPIRVDVRVVATTSADLRVAVHRVDFPQHLYFKMALVSIGVPPLRDRREDIPLLAAHFAEQCCARMGRKLAGISPETHACLMGYQWPGNVRELRDVIERAVRLASSDWIDPQDLPKELTRSRATIV